MSGGEVLFECQGCGAAVDAARALPFRCPGAGRVDDVDHLLAPREVAAAWPAGGEAHPFVRYRALLSPYRVARAAGLPDGVWADLVGALDEALVRADGRGFRVTPLAPAPALARAAGLAGELWVKDETRNVSGSHKARHLMGAMLYLRVLETARLPAGEGLRARRLAIASCGNAAMAAAVVARAAEWPLDVFIPP
ncbi:MAG: pyridoxal-phosphate dependent enzyme, partial [Anaeromyxobacteraceae bacterium]